jgi:hypothetical protein
MAPIVVGIIFRLAFVDTIPKTDQYEFMLEHYGKSLWIEFIVLSYVLAAGVLLTDRPNISPATRMQLFGLPIACFLICVFLSIVLPKFGLSGNFLTVWGVAAVGLISFIWVAFLVTDVRGQESSGRGDEKASDVRRSGI